MPKLTREFREMPDYQDAFASSSEVFFGRRRDLNLYWDDVMQHKKQSQYFGCVLCPEQRGGNWSYDSNKAFFAGIIDAGRTLKLVNDIETEEDPLKYGYVADELFWLQDNGYTFEPDPDYKPDPDLTKKKPWPTIAKPPSASAAGTSMRGVIMDYNKGRGADSRGGRAARLARFDAIRSDILRLRPSSQSTIVASHV